MRRGRLLGARLASSLCLVMALMGGFVIASDVSAQAPSPIFPGTSPVGLIPPVGMVASKRFSGFEHESGASILMMDMPGYTYAQFIERFTPEGLRPTGFIVTNKAEPLTIAEGEGVVLRGSQMANGRRYRKWVAITRRGDNGAMITVQVPAESDAISDDAVVAALRTVAFRPLQPTAEQVAALPYNIGDLAGFRVVRTFLGNGLLLTDGAKDVDPGGEQPMVIVAPSLGPVYAAGQEEAFARKALATLDRLTEVRETGKARNYRQAGVPTVQLHGEAKNSDSGRALHWSQTILFHDGGYLRLVATAPVEKAEAIERADRLAATVTVKPSPETAAE